MAEPEYPEVGTRFRHEATGEVCLSLDRWVALRHASSLGFDPKESWVMLVTITKPCRGITQVFTLDSLGRRLTRLED